MRTLFYTTLLSFFVLSFTSCFQKRAPQVEDTLVTVIEEPEQEFRREETQERSETKKVQTGFKISDIDSFNKLQKYNVVVATMSQQSSVQALSNFFDRDGIEYTVIKNPAGLYYFIVYTSDSEEDAIKARGTFLVRNTVDTSRDELWHRYYVQLTDTFILEKN